MTSISCASLARALGAVVGVALAGLVLVAARPGADASSSLPATLRVSIPLTGELEVTPPSPRPVLLARSLSPGGNKQRSTFTLRNQTAKTLRVGFRARARSTALDGLLGVRLSVRGGPVLADGTLQGLRDGTESTIIMPSASRRELLLEAWIPGEITDGYHGQRVDFSLLPTIDAGG